MPDYSHLNKEQFKLYKITLINTICCICSKAIEERLWDYLGYVRVAEEDRKYVKMKNEFYNEVLMVTYAMKSYISLQLRQEADVYKEPKLDVKGVNFFKSTSSERTTQFIYKDLLMDQLLQPKDEKIDIGRVYETMHRYEMNMYNDIKSGDMGYLKRSIKVKSPDGYAKPMSIGQYKAVWVWNQICEQKDIINLPSVITIVKVKLNKVSDLAPLASSHPQIYEKLLNLFETNIYVGGGKSTTVKDGKTIEINMPAPGIKAIALPADYEYVPDWLLKIIDTESIIADNMKLFTQINKCLGLSGGATTHNGSNITYYSNIVRI